MEGEGHASSIDLESQQLEVKLLAGAGGHRDFVVGAHFTLHWRSRQLAEAQEILLHLRGAEAPAS